MGEAMDASGELLALVSNIYDATLDGALWPVVLAQISDWLGSESCHFFLMNGSSGTLALCHAVRTDPVLLQEYDAHYASVNPWVRPALTTPVGAVVTDEALYSARELRRTEFFNDWLRRRDVGHGLFTIALHDEQWLGALSLYRSDAKGAFKNSEIGACQLIAPHLRRALQLTQRLVRAEGLASGTVQALQGTAQAILLFNGEGRAMFISEAARQVLQHSRALSLDKEGRLRATSLSTDRTLQNVLGGTLHPQDGRSIGGVVAIPRVAPMGPLVVMVAPVSTGSSVFPDLNPAVIVYISDPSRGEHGGQNVLTKVYGLTAMEAKVALQLLSGERLPAIADSLGLSVNTVRTHVKHAFSKTGTRSQTQLVSLMLRLPH